VAAHPTLRHWWDSADAIPFDLAWLVVKAERGGLDVSAQRRAVGAFVSSPHCDLLTSTSMAVAMVGRAPVLSALRMANLDDVCAHAGYAAPDVSMPIALLLFGRPLRRPDITRGRLL